MGYFFPRGRVSSPPGVTSPMGNELQKPAKCECYFRDESRDGSEGAPRVGPRGSGSGGRGHSLQAAPGSLATRLQRRRCARAGSVYNRPYYALGRTQDYSRFYDLILSADEPATFSEMLNVFSFSETPRNGAILVNQNSTSS